MRHDVFPWPGSLPGRFELLAHLQAPRLAEVYTPRQVLFAARHEPGTSWRATKSSVQLACEPRLAWKGMLPVGGAGLHLVLYSPILQVGLPTPICHAGSVIGEE
jgi:hypothetical protein